MGQRFQSVFILPEVFMNENNPNNRSEKVIFFHNQWLYGRGAININLLIIERLKKAISKRKNAGAFAVTKKDFINHHLEDSINNAIKWASIQELHNETRFSQSNELIYSDEEKKPKIEQRTLKELFKFQDNNNGFFVCRITKNLNIEYAFLNGFEDANLIKQRTPKEYLNLFYKDEDLKKDIKVYEYMQNQFKKFEKFKVLEPSFLNPIIEHLNIIEVYN